MYQQIINMKTIKANTILSSRSICDHNCIFKLIVVERKKNFVKIIYNNRIRRVKVYSDSDGEFLRPDKYSMSPTFRV